MKQPKATEIPKRKNNGGHANGYHKKQNNNQSPQIVCYGITAHQKTPNNQGGCAQIACCANIGDQQAFTYGKKEKYCGNGGQQRERRNSFCIPNKDYSNNKKSDAIHPVRCGGATNSEKYKGSPPGRLCGQYGVAGQGKF